MVKGKRRPAKSELPQPPEIIKGVQAMPPKPKLGKMASAIWDELATKLSKSGIICEYDGRLLAAYCYAAADVEELRSHLTRYGRFRVNSNNTKTPREEVKALKDAEDRFMKIGAQLGLSPAARKSLKIKIETGEQDGASSDPAADLC